MECYYMIAANALFWSTQDSNVIKKLSLVDLDDDSQTATPETISLGENASPNSFALSADKIFWSDVNQKGLFSIPRDSTSQGDVERWSDQVFRGLTTLIHVDTEETGDKKHYCHSIILYVQYVMCIVFIWLTMEDVHRGLT